MSKKTKIWLIIASSLVLIGCIIFSVVMTMLKWDFTKLSTVKYETNNYEISEDYKNISIVTDTADIVFAPAKNLKTSVLCYEQKNIRHSVAVQNGALIIESLDTRKWYEYIGINFGSPKITVYIPQGEYGALSIKSDTGNVEIPKDFSFESIDISESTGNVTSFAAVLDTAKIKTSTGNIRVENISSGALDLCVSTGDVIAQNISCAGDIKIKVSTGRAKLMGVTCKNIISNGSTGDISLKNVIATEKFSIERSTGDVKLEKSDAAELFIKTDTGDITGSLLSQKVFIAQSDTGNINLPKTVTGGRCELITDTGDIKIDIE